MKELVKRDLNQKWFTEFFSLFPYGAAWNERSNEWLNEQCASGVSPFDAYNKCTVTEL